MFLKRRGHRVDVLHSVRDGRGYVRHRRLYQFLNVRVLADQLHEDRWGAWEDEMRRRCPDIRFSADRLRAQAEALVEKSSTSSESPMAPTLADVHKACRVLQRMFDSPEVVRAALPHLQELREQLAGLESEDALQALQIKLETGELDVREELTQLSSECRSVLSKGRKRVDASEPRASSYLRGMDLLAQKLFQDGQLEESLNVLQQRANCSPAPATLLAQGATLLRLGRAAEAVSQFEQLPGRCATRHYNLAAAHWAQGHYELAVDRLLDAFVRNRSVAESLVRKSPHQYWQEFGDLWDQPGRTFLLSLYKQLMVRWPLSRLRERPRIVRCLLSSDSRAKLLERLPIPRA
jgi:tetratricopeptide (TPR) repeat protein